MFKSKTIDGCLKQFSTVVDNLKKIAEEKNQEVARQGDIISKAEDHRNAALAEQKRALAVASSIEEVFKL